MQPMVVSAKDRVRQEFGRLFNEELDRVGAPKQRGRVAWVYRNLKDKQQRPLVSVEQVRKYVRGIDFPDQANLRLLCERLQLDWLKFQVAAAPETTALLTQPDRELLELWKALQKDVDRQEVLAMLR